MAVQLIRKVRPTLLVTCTVSSTCENSFLLISTQWTSAKDLKRARQVEYQKLQRKFRKERKDVEKLAAILKEAEENLANRETLCSVAKATLPSKSSSLRSESPEEGNSASIMSMSSVCDRNFKVPSESLLNSSIDEAKISDPSISITELGKIPEPQAGETIPSSRGTLLRSENESPSSDSNLRQCACSSVEPDEGKGWIENVGCA